MTVFIKNHTLIINLIICTTLIFSGSKSMAARKQNKEYKTLPEIQHPSEKTLHFSNKLEEARTKTEFLDDQTEKIINRNKTPILLGIIILIGLFIQSIITFRKN